MLNFEYNKQQQKYEEYPYAIFIVEIRSEEIPEEEKEHVRNETEKVDYHIFYLLGLLFFDGSSPLIAINCS